MANNTAHSGESELKKYELTDNTEISPGVHVIAFRRDFDFIPGQVVKIGVDDEFPPRIYSICSGNKEDEVRILFNVKNEGKLTPRLAGMIPGEKIGVSKPYGSFLSDDQPAWWIATGTGIAPFYSMFCSQMSKNKKLFHGVRYLNQFYFEDELEYGMGDNYIRCCSAETSCDVFPGRVTQYLAGIKDFPVNKYYLCGSANMVVEVRDLLIEKGIPFGNILAEIYF